MSIFAFQTAALNVLIDFEKQLFVVPGFGEKIGGPEPNRLHRRFDRAVGGQHDDRRFPVPRADILQHVESGAIGKHQVQQHQVEALGIQGGNTGGSIGRGRNLVLLQLEQCLETFENHVFVVDDEDAAFGLFGGLRRRPRHEQLSWPAATRFGM